MPLAIATEYVAKITACSMGSQYCSIAVTPAKTVVATASCFLVRNMVANSQVAITLAIETNAQTTGVGALYISKNSAGRASAATTNLACRLFNGFSMFLKGVVGGLLCGETVTSLSRLVIVDCVHQMVFAKVGPGSSREV